MDPVKTGTFITELRKEQGLTQKQLAQALGVSDKTVSKWECGRGLPEISIMLKVCEEFQITVNELLSGERLDDRSYRARAEENMLTLMQEKGVAKKVIHVAVSILLFLIPGISILLVVGEILEPIITLVVCFESNVLLAINFSAGITYGILKKWNKLFLICAAALDIILTVQTGILFWIMAAAFYAV